MQSVLVAQVTGTQVQTDGPGVQVSGVVVTVPSGATIPPPEHVAPSAWQVSGAGQSATVLHACGLATQTGVPVCGGGVSHVVFAGHAGAIVGIISITQSKSALGQSATVAQTIGLGSQMPVMGVGTGSGVGTDMGGSSPASGPGRGAAPPSVAGTGGLVGGVAVVAQLVPDAQVLAVAAPAPELAVLPPAPPVPTLAPPVTGPAPTLVAPPVAAPVPATACPKEH